MSRKRGKISALVGLAVALPVTIVALWRPASEAWYLHQLESRDSPAVFAAMRALDELRCHRAILPIAEALSREVDKHGLYVSELAILRDRRALKSLLEVFQSEKVDGQIREAFLFGIAEVHGSRGVPLLERALIDEDWSVRRSAFEELRSLGPLALDALPAIRASGEWQEWDQGIFGLDPVQEKLKLWESLDPLKRCEAIRGHFDEHGLKAAFPILARSSTLRDSALWLAIWIYLNDPAVMTGQMYSEAMDFELSMFVPWLLGDFDDETRFDKAAVIRTLGEIGPASSAALPAIRAALEEEDPFLRVEAAHALARIDPMSPPRVDVLVDVIQSRLDAAPKAIQALGHFGPRARGAVPVLLELVGDPTLDRLCVMALAAIDPRALVEHAGAPGSPEWERVVQCCQRSSEMWAELIWDGSTVPFLRGVVQGLRSDEQQEWVFRWVFKALQSCGPAAAPALPELLGILGQVDDPRRGDALTCIGALRQAGAPALPTLFRQLREGRPPWKVQIARALAGIGLPAVDGLMAALSDPDEDVRALAAFALSQIGRRAERAVEALRARLTDSSSIVRIWAARAIEQLQCSSRANR